MGSISTAGEGGRARCAQLGPSWHPGRGAQQKTPPVAETQQTRRALVLQTGREEFLQPEGTAALSIVPAARPSPS